MTRVHLQIVVCGAGPAEDVAELIRVAHERSWTAAITATASALGFLNVPAVEALTGLPVRSSYERCAGPRVLAPVGAVIVAPATYNTINKLALGIADSYALASIAELIGRGVPAVVVPFVNAALAARSPFHHSIAALRAEGVRVLSGPADRWEPHPPGKGTDMRAAFPWHAAFQAAEDMSHNAL